jgi:hypothetical protein
MLKGGFLKAVDVKKSTVCDGLGRLIRSVWLCSCGMSLIIGLFAAEPIKKGEAWWRLTPDNALRVTRAHYETMVASETAASPCSKGSEDFTGFRSQFEAFLMRSTRTPTTTTKRMR